jgi:dTDP-4-amino-4,6-dideoxygalactose transaminase
MSLDRIPLIDVPEQARYVEIAALRVLEETIETGRFIGGAAIAAFEETAAEWHGAEYAIACDSGSAALLAAMYACGVRNGTTFATPVMTFISVVEAAWFLRAVPVYQDIAVGTWMMHAFDHEVSRYPDRQCGTAIPVALYGRHIPPGFYGHETLIVDAAQAHGQMFYDEFTAMTLSFYPGKVMGAFGDGGMVLTNDKAVAGKVRAFVNHGRGAGEKYTHRGFGFNFRMDVLQAAILKEKYAFLETWVQGRGQVAEWYFAALGAEIAESDILLPDKNYKDAGHSWHLYVVLLGEGSDRDSLCAFLMGEGIETGVHYPVPLHRQPLYPPKHQGGFTNGADLLAGRGLSLPIYPEMTESDVARVTETLKKGIKICRKE